MDDRRFDHLTRTLRSRRTALGGLLVGAAAMLGLASEPEVAAHNAVPRCRKIQDAKKRQACLRRAKAHKRWHKRTTCVPVAVATTCANRCGTAGNNCGQAVSCPLCSPERTCLNNGSCATSCPTFITCPAGCFCSDLMTDGTYMCFADVDSCDAVPRECTSTAECPALQACVNADCLPRGRCVPLCQL